MAWMKVAANRPMASWLGRSSSSERTIRGENWPMASCTTTSATVSTRVVIDTIEVAKVLRADSTALGPPVRPEGISRLSKRRSTAGVASERAMPAATQSSGTSQRPDHSTRRARDSRIA
jgi:hypothetical protein